MLVCEIVVIVGQELKKSNQRQQLSVFKPNTKATAGNVGMCGIGDGGSGSSGARREIKYVSNPTLVFVQTQYLPIPLNAQSLVE